MQRLDLTLSTPEENLALDEALLEMAEGADKPSEVLRTWEPASPMVVVGRSSRIEAEVDQTACGRRGIPILRRISGGAAVVAGPGCLMYALVLDRRLRPELDTIDRVHYLVLTRLTQALSEAVVDVRCQGTSDLAVGERKFSGNSARSKRDHVLYHGTLLYGMAPSLIAQCLRPPPRTPRYRNGRSHEQFVTTLPLTAETLRGILTRAWRATEPFAGDPLPLVKRLVAQRYGQAEWNEQR